MSAADIGLSRRVQSLPSFQSPLFMYFTTQRVMSPFAIFLKNVW